MLQYKSLASLPTAEDLPETDFQPVDNELQYLVPGILRSALALAWAERSDWLLGVNLGIYYDPQQSAICPDAFLVLGVPRYRPEKGLRLSYVFWEEQYTVPQWVLEVVSQTPGGEYTKKMDKYAQMQVPYYTIYNPKHWKRDQHEPFEVYQLINGTYGRLMGNPVWLPPIGLGIGAEQGTLDGHTREWLYWYNQAGDRYPIADDIIREQQQRAQQEQQRAEQEQQRAEQEQQRAEQERQRAEQLSTQLQQERQRAQQEAQLRQALLEKLRSHNIDPDTL